MNVIPLSCELARVFESLYAKLRQSIPTPDNRSVNFFSLFHCGQHYSKTRPLEKRFTPVFVENHVVKMTHYVIRFMPPIVVFTLCWQIAPGGQPGSAATTVLFALSLSMQGLQWLGERSIAPSSPAILNWSYEVCSKLQESGQVLAPVEGKSDYQALTDTLKRAFKQLDKTFLDGL